MQNILVCLQNIQYFNYKYIYAKRNKYFSQYIQDVSRKPNYPNIFSISNSTKIVPDVT